MSAKKIDEPVGAALCRDSINGLEDIVSADMIDERREMLKTADAPKEPGDDSPARSDRRALLEKLGTLSYYTPPVMLTLLLASKPSAASTSCSGSLNPFDSNAPPCDPG
jgi:hypothetical protein